MTTQDAVKTAEALEITINRLKRDVEEWTALAMDGAALNLKMQMEHYAPKRGDIIHLRISDLIPEDVSEQVIQHLRLVLGPQENRAAIIFTRGDSARLELLSPQERDIVVLNLCQFCSEQSAAAMEESLKNALRTAGVATPVVTLRDASVATRTDTQKVVVNICRGVFGLSRAACLRLLELGVPRKGEHEAEEGPYIGDPGEYEWVGEDKDRADPRLVQVVEEMGYAASEVYSNLIIREIPAGRDWHIEEYNGIEKIVEKHDTW
jgi:hypothetical protein